MIEQLGNANKERDRKKYELAKYYAEVWLKAAPAADINIVTTEAVKYAEMLLEKLEKDSTRPF